MNARAATNATTHVTANRSEQNEPIRTNNGTEISEISNSPKFRQVLYPPMILSELDSVIYIARVLDTADRPY